MLTRSLLLLLPISILQLACDDGGGASSNALGAAGATNSDATGGTGPRDQLDGSGGTGDENGTGGASAEVPSRCWEHSESYCASAEIPELERSVFLELGVDGFEQRGGHGEYSTTNNDPVPFVTVLEVGAGLGRDRREFEGLVVDKGYLVFPVGADYAALLPSMFIEGPAQLRTQQNYDTAEIVALQEESLAAPNEYDVKYYDGMGAGWSTAYGNNSSGQFVVESAAPVAGGVDVKATFECELSCMFVDCVPETIRVVRGSIYAKYR